MDGSQILGRNFTSKALERGSRAQYGKKKTVKALNDISCDTLALSVMTSYKLY